jgi:RNA polymerase sigma-70 factor (ECF subfamily)
VADADVLFAEHRQGVFRYLARIVGQTDAAHDLTQEVFLRVARAGVPEADAAGRRAWVFRIARNLALNYLRDRQRKTPPVALVDVAGPPSQELGLALRQAIAGLQEVDRDVFLLREAAGLSYGEIAVSCDLSLEAVRARLHRARVELRAALDGPLRRSPPTRVSYGGDDAG